MMEALEFYREEFARFQEHRAHEPAWLKTLRQEAFARFESMGLPNRRTESWKYTSVKPFVATPFRVVPNRAQGTPSPVTEDASLVSLQDCHRLVFTNGHFDRGASSLSGLPEGVVLKPLAEALVGEVDPSLKEALQLELEKVGEMPFSALNLAFFTDGVWLSVPSNVRLETPVHLLHRASATEQPHLAQTRSLIVAGTSSEMSVLETFQSSDNASYFTNTVTSVETGKNAFVDHYKIQEEATQGLHIGHIESVIERDAHFSNHVVHVGGKLVRNEVRATFLDSNATCTLNGLSIAGEGQAIDNRTNIEHAKPHCDSFQTYKTILDANGKGVFNGKIHVHQDAQKTDAKQNNQALLLSDHCTINSKPELEIYADDVRCTHGATTGYLDEESMFYLRSRGISPKDARGILTFAFANEVVETFRNSELSAQLEEYLAQRFRKQ